MFLQSYCYSSGLHPLGAQGASGKKYPFGGSRSLGSLRLLSIVASTSYSGAVPPTGHQMELISDTESQPTAVKEASKNRAQGQSLKAKKGFRSNDNLADLLSRIRNGYFRSFEDILVIDSKQNRELLDALICTGYIYNWSEAPIAADGCNWRVATVGGENSPNKSSILQVNLKYFQNIPAIRGIQQISRPGNRTYINIKRILKYSQEQN